MEFSYDGYGKLIDSLRKHHYDFASYHDWKNITHPVIMRHDIDNSIECALHLAEFENAMGANSTFFVLLTSDFYNVFSLNNMKMLKQIMNLGHEIGLHFDEVRYPDAGIEDISRLILQEAEVLSKVIESKVSTVSMHRPSKNVLSANIEIPGMVNSYGKVYFEDFKYLSDSRRRWREPVDDIVSSEKI